MKTGGIFSLLAGIAGFIAGCAVMHFILPRAQTSENAAAPSPHGTIKREQAHVAVVQAQVESARKPVMKGAQAAALRGSAARRLLSEIKRDKVAAVEVRFFAKNEFHVADGKLSQQFVDLFELAPAEAGKLSEMVHEMRMEMWNAAKSQAQMSRTETGGVILKIPPLAEGPDIYSKVMDGFREVLGDERYNDMVLFNKSGAGGQFEDLFRQFGAEERTVTIEKSNDGRYKIMEHVVGRPGERSSGYFYTGGLDEIKKRSPEYVEFVPVQ